MSTTTINFRIDQVSKAELQEIADKQGIKVSGLVREIITTYLERYYSSDIKPHVVVLKIPPNYTPPDYNPSH